MNLNIFSELDFLPALHTFFEKLNIPIHHIADEPTSAKEILIENHKENDTFALTNDVYFVGMVDDAAFGKRKATTELKDIKTDYDGVLIFGITLYERPNGLLPTRTQLAEIARAFNREFYYTPVVVVFKYDNHIAFANTERLQYKQEWLEGEKAGKVTLLRDVNIEKPHAGHQRILAELKIPTTGRHKVDSFAKLYTYWQEVMSVNILNKKFYKELSNWYFWAIQNVRFPGETALESKVTDIKSIDDLKQEHKAENVIRMLTRLLFVWFLKEKKLIPEDLFDLKALQEDILNKIDPIKNYGVFKEQNIESIYYKAILQNLFFATLNCPIESDSIDNRKRGFRLPKSNFGTLFLMRYEEYFKDKDAFLEMVNQTVPFLNGGLFECLDERGEGEKKDERKWIDGFSDNLPKDQQLVVPDYLFFGREEETDLSDVVGISTREYKQADVKGLISILESYKFTITENTPIEEDVALDPELLGKVFENLLASYNPETKTTARKQTGSFYTPREIVNYMVDESLIAYLNNAIDTECIEEVESNQEATETLRQLVSFDPVNPFSKYNKLTKDIITALSTCTIIDPACGSGAFPMGVLQKMVHILQKLDPSNEIWFDVQFERANEESKNVLGQIEDEEGRQERLNDIYQAFDQTLNDPDYARKLFLIENCIYGVDIQSIATQISKLRFFISLVVDQKVNPDKKNFGIRALPNLETKFVAANTLIGIDRPKKGDQLNMFSSEKLQQLEAELKIVRSKLFSAKTRATKVKYRNRDEELRKEIAAELLENGWESDTAQKLASWDPYDQNASSSFFDPEWMFDIKEGFDVMIGNPPWGAKLTKEDKANFKLTYPKIDSSTPNSFAYFIGEAMLHSKGVISYVLPDSLLIKDFAKTRKWLKDNIYEISWYLNTGISEEFKPFVYVEHDVCVLLINLTRKTDQCLIKKQEYDFELKKQVLKEYSIKKDDFIFKEHDYAYNLKIEQNEIELYEKIKKLPLLGSILQCHEGIHTGNSRDILFHKNTGEGDFKPLFHGGRAGDKISNYLSETSGWYVDYRKEIINKDKGKYASLRDERIFMFPKIYITRTGNPIKAFYDDNTYASNNFFSLQFKDYNFNTKENLKQILPLILSKFANYYIRTYAAPRLGDTFIETKIIHILKVPYIENLTLHNKLRDLTSFIFYCIRTNKKHDSFINVTDSYIFNLYFSNHMKNRDIEVIEFIENDIEKHLKGKDFDRLNNEEKENVIEHLYTIWNNPNNEVVKRIGMFREKSPDLLGMILDS